MWGDALSLLSEESNCFCVSKTHKKVELNKKRTNYERLWWRTCYTASEECVWSMCLNLYPKRCTHCLNPVIEVDQNAESKREHTEHMQSRTHRNITETAHVKQYSKLTINVHTAVFSVCVTTATAGTCVWMNPDRSPLPWVWPLAAQFIKLATQVFATQVQI